MSEKLINYKKAFSVLTAMIIALLCTFLPTSASASADSVAVSQVRADIISNAKLYENNKELCDRIADGIDKLQDQIYVGDLTFEAKQLPYIIKTVIRKHPELFFIDTKQFGVGSDDKGIVVLCPVYLSDKSTIEQKRKVFDTRVNEILSLTDKGMTDLEKAIIIHDELALNCEYIDENNTIKYVTAYNCLIGGKANCQGYAGAYSYLLSLLGIRTEVVESSSMYHVWNKVCIDGKFYNVDLTWDDPVVDMPGYVGHNYFLLSDNAIINGDEEIAQYFGFDYESCVSDSTKYDKAQFHKINTRFCYIGSDFYVIDNKYGSNNQKCLLRFDLETGQADVLKKFDYKWPSSGTKFWKDTYMSLDVNDDLLYLNSLDGIFTYDVSTNQMNTYNFDKNVLNYMGANDKFYGLLVKRGKVYVSITDNPNNSWRVYEVGECVDRPVTIGEKRRVNLESNLRAEILFGDVNLDGHINIIDVTDIQKSIISMITLGEKQFVAADVNNDKVVNVLDCTIIQKFIVNVS